MALSTEEIEQISSRVAQKLMGVPEKPAQDAEFVIIGRTRVPIDQVEAIKKRWRIGQTKHIARKLLKNI